MSTPEIIECFTGYLSQQNFDSQWISTSGKDAFNSVGVGAFFNLMNFGQMLMWHIVLVPLILVAVVGAHVLLVRTRGVAHPIGAKVKFAGGNPVVPRADDGPVPAMMADELTLARSGALDADLLAQQPFYGTNFTKPLLFIEDGQFFANQATAMNLSGGQWGVMNETGSYPGQPWLWLYTLWYQVPGWTNSANIDMIAIYMTGLATILQLLVPFIPGLREIPRLIPVHRLIWRSWNRPEAVPSGSGRAVAATARIERKTGPRP